MATRLQGTFYGARGQQVLEQNRRLQASSAGGGIQDIITQMQTAQAKANRANERRYRETLAQFENLGVAGRARIEQQTGQRQAAATQGLVSRGLGSTTITSAVERGIASDAELSRQQLEESVAVQKAGVMERRTDEGPDLSMFANLLQLAGQQSGGGGQSQSVIRQFGPMAAQGKTIFGRPFRYTAGSTLR